MNTNNRVTEGETILTANTCGGTEQLLNRIDIIAAVNYYGITELLDIIGEEEIRSYLELHLAKACP